MEIIHVVDNSEVNKKVREVVYSASNQTADCSCKMFQSQGMSCRHILCILKGKGLNEIPNNYIVHRWTKMTTRKSIFDVDDKVLEGCSTSKNESQLILDEWNHIFACMREAGKSKKKLSLLINGVIDVKKQLIELRNGSTKNKTKDIETFIGYNLPKEIDIHPPQISKTKESGK